MKVRDAEIFGFFGSIISVLSSFEYNPYISLLLGVSGVTSFILGKKITGATGGVLRGIGYGFSFVAILQQFNLVIQY